MVLVRELTASCVEILQRRLDAALAVRLGRGRVTRLQLREVVPLGPLLDEHLPVVHPDRSDQKLRSAGNQMRPVERDRQLTGREERTIALADPRDRKIADLDSSGEHADAQRTDADRSLQLV